MGNEMTELTQSLYDQAVYSLMTVQEAVDFLERESKLRTLAEKLNSFAKGRDLQEVLTAGLLEHHPEMKKDSDTIYDFFDISRPRDLKSETIRKSKEFIKKTIGQEKAQQIAKKLKLK